MLNEEDAKWLGENYPRLIPTPDGISGTIEITATYNLETNRFLKIQRGAVDDVGGVRLTGSFNISICERIVKPFSELPALMIEGVEAVANRHINICDGTACLCSPLVEDEYLIPKFQFQFFFEKLVVPFLYGQLFYSREKSWPWPDYGHGSVGLLESYERLGNPKITEKCLLKLSHDNNWQSIKSALKQKSEIKKHTLCFCEAKDKIARCHPMAWDGIKRLRFDIADQNITIP